MSEIERIIDQLQRAFFRDAWSGASVLEVLSGVTAERALSRPLVKSHSIWEIVLHMAGWKQVVSERLKGNPVKLPFDGDWPEVAETSEAAWEATLEKLRLRHDELIEAVQNWTDDRLENLLITDTSRESGGGVSCYVTLHGIAQHDLYHAGQIALLKKK